MSIRLILKLTISFVIANVILFIGRDDITEYVFSELYLIDIGISWLDVLIVLEYVDRVNQYLDKMNPWNRGFKIRLIKQGLLVVTIPTVMVVVITTLQDTFIYQQVTLTGIYFLNEFIVSVLFILMTNLVFLVIFFIQNPKEKESEPITILGSRAGQKIPVSSDEIAFISLRNEIVYATTFDWEEVILADNMDSYESQLSKSDFFRTNRQVIVHRRSCKSYKSIENGKIEIELNPERVERIIVSQKRAARFRTWIKK